MLDGKGDGVDFLDELGADQGSDAPAAAAGKKHARFAGADAGVGFHPLQELQTLLGLLGVVALVVAPDDLLRFDFHDDRLHRRGTDIQTDNQVLRTRHSSLPAEELN